MNREDLIREYHNRASSWQAVVLVYGIIVGSMLFSASLII